MPLHLQAWVLLLISVNIVAPFFFLEHVEGQAVLAAGALGMVLMTALTARFGFSRIIGVGHVAWVPLLGFLWSQQLIPEAAIEPDLSEYPAITGFKSRINPARTL